TLGLYSLDIVCFLFFFSSRRRHTRFSRDWSSDVCSSDLWHDIRVDDRDRVRGHLIVAADERERGRASLVARLEAESDISAFAANADHPLLDAGPRAAKERRAVKPDAFAGDAVDLATRIEAIEVERQAIGVVDRV